MDFGISVYNRLTDVWSATSFSAHAGGLLIGTMNLLPAIGGLLKFHELKCRLSKTLICVGVCLCSCAGIPLGLLCLVNIREVPRERVMQIISIVVIAAFVIFAVCWNIFYPGYLEPDWGVCSMYR